MIQHYRSIVALILTPIALVGCGDPEEKRAPVPVDFVTQIKPILQENCIVCHNTETLLGEINLENRELAFGESERGKFIVPGDPDASLLYTMTLSPHGKRELPAGVEKPMPLQAPDLAAAEKDLLKRWIEEGANWPKGAEGHIKPLPDPKSGSWVPTPFQKMRAIVRYVMERIKWELAGKPMRSPERVHEIYHQICKPCPHFGGDRCNVCGCYISDHLKNPKFNKLAWFTTHCPLPEPKWTEEQKAKVDLQKAEKLAEEEVAEMEKPPQVHLTTAQHPHNTSGCCGS